jgi:hypothetical protein
MHKIWSKGQGKLKKPFQKSEFFKLSVYTLNNIEILDDYE